MKPMRALLAILATIGATGLAPAQSPDAAAQIPGLESLPPASQQLARIRAHMADILTHQPNYTCLETVERSYRAAGSRRLTLDDTIRMEVALVDGQEMFAWPGSKKFEETDLRKLIPSGTFGNGNFALHARSVFLGRVATFEYRGAEIFAGAPGPLERYDFHVPRQVSGYTIRMEVALVDGQEMFAWPGSKKFEETDLRKLIPSGTFGNGNFALHARSVFLGRVATFEYRGAEIFAGAPGPLERYDFHVPRLVSGYTIRMEDRSGVAGYHGSFWAEKQTLDVRRLEVIAEEIPSDLGVTAASDRVDYARLPIGTGELLLPVESELKLADKYNLESENRVHFTSCRQYTGESTLKFDDPDATPAAASSTPVELPQTDFPAGLEFSLVLDQDVDVDTAAVGDPVRMLLNGDVRRKGEVLAHKGATASGRITRLERRENITVLGITITALETSTATLRVNAKLDDVVGLQLFAPPRNLRVQTGPAQPGEGLIVLRTGHVRLIRGILMYWRS
jgi:hypothetical protein